MKVTYLVLSLSLVQKETKSCAADGRRDRKKEEGSSSSLLYSCAVWPAFVRHSGVIYHVHDA